MKARLKRWAYRLCQFIPIWLWRLLFPESALVFCYHMISDERVAHVKHYPYLDSDQFERDLNALESRFQYASYEQLVEQKLLGPRVSATKVCLTFDDGFAQCATVVRPILLRHRATCIFFIVTDLIDNRTVFFETRSSLCIDAVLQRPAEEIEALIGDMGIQPRLPIAGREDYARAPPQMATHWKQSDPRLRPFLFWLLTIERKDSDLLDRLCQRLGVDVAGYVDKVQPYLSTQQILQLRADGFTIGAHSRSHRRLQDLSRADAEQEIVESCRTIQNLTGQASVPFAFPYMGGDLDRSWLAKLRQQHPFIGLFFDTQGLRNDSSSVVQRVFGERIEETGSIDRLLRRAWLRRLA